MDDAGETTGADFAASFLRAMESRGADTTAISPHQLAHWFDLALDQGRRTQPPAPGWVTLASAADETGRLAVRPEDIVVVVERPDATAIRVDGVWLPVCEEYEAVVRMAAIP
jgi:hypothetical protein